MPVRLNSQLFAVHNYLVVMVSLYTRAPNPIYLFICVNLAFKAFRLAKFLPFKLAQTYFLFQSATVKILPIAKTS